MAGLPLSRRVFLQLGSMVAAEFQKLPSTLRRDGATFVEESSGAVTIGNELLSITFRKDNGGIEQIEDAAGVTTLRSAGSRPVEHWYLEFYHDDYEKLVAPSYAARPPDIETDQDGGAASVTLTYERPELKSSAATVEPPRFDGTVEVTVTVERGDPLAYWSVDVSNRSELAIKHVDAPRISHITSIAPGGEDALVYPDRRGRRVPNPASELSFGITHRYPSKFGNMQFTAFTGPETGFYADARDTAGNTKELSWEQMPGVDTEGGRLRYRARYRLPRQPGEDVAVPYETTFGVMEGDWHDAAERYREWLDRKGWLPETPPAKPDWFLDTGAVHMLRSYNREEARAEETNLTFEETADLAIEMKEYLGVPMQMRWTGWETHGRPSGADRFPPKEGMAAFERVYQRLLNNGIGVIGFIGLAVGFTFSDFWRNNPEKMERWAVKNRDGSLETHADSAGVSFVEMEAVQEGWMDRCERDILTLVETGANQIHLDGFPVLVRPDCYNPAHDHPPGRGGNWFASRMRPTLDGLRAEMAGIRDDVVLEGEGICDFYLPQMNAHVLSAHLHAAEEITSGVAEPIPLFQYTFDDLVESQPMSHEPLGDGNRELLRLYVGQSVPLGAVPAFRLPVSPSADVADEEMLRYFRRVARARAYHANRFMARGEMLRAPQFDTRTIEVSGRGETVPTDEILAGAWRSEGAEVGVVFTSVSNDPGPRETTFDVAAQPFDVPTDPGLAYRVTNGAYERVADGDEVPDTLAVSLEPGDVELVVFAPATGKRSDALDGIVEAQDVATTESQRERLDAAKRAFERGDLEGATEIAQQVLQSPSTESPGEPSVATSSSEGPRETTTESTTSTEAPGFGLLAGVAGGVGALAGWLQSRLEEDS